MNQNRSKTLTIDVSNYSKDEDFVHAIITFFDFPDIYGHSLFSLKEHFFYDPDMRLPNELIVSGMTDLKTNLPNAYSTLKKALDAHQKNNPKFSYQY